MVNRVILVGNLAAEPEVRATPKGTYVANLRVATHSYTGKDEEGKRRETTEFHHLVAWGKTAEFAGQFLHKGRLVSAEGRLQTRSWDDNAGQKRYRTEVLVEELKALGPKPAEEAAAA